MSDSAEVPTFAALIGDARRRKGWSQDDLEAETGVSRSTVSRWERGLADNPEPAHVRAVCAALGIDPRTAAIALGYLTPEEVDGSRPTLDPEVEQVLKILESGAISDVERQNWIDYLKFLYSRREGAPPAAAAS